MKPRLVHVCAILAAVFAAGRAADIRGIAWERHAFDLPESIWSVAAADTDGDGKRDLVAMGVTKVFALSVPRGEPRTLFDARDGKMLYCVALDVNHDKRDDIVLGRYLVPWIEYRQARALGKEAAAPQGPEFSVGWIENPGRAGGPWPLHVWDRELNGIHGIWLGDVDRDGQPDLLADSISGPAFANSVVWFAIPRTGDALPVRHVITKGGADGRPHYLDFADLNGDGRGDVLLGDSGRGTFTWWENRGTGAEWTRHLIAQERGATNLKAADVNGDGKLDVVGTCGHGKGVFWFEAGTWTKHVIDAELATPHALVVADFDGDGDVDVAVASYTAFVVRWYENDGKGNFTPHDIDTDHQQQAYDMKVADLDADGRPDLILAGRESKNAVWYRNRSR